MSRWTDKFKDQGFQQNWKQIITVSKTLEAPNKTNQSEVEEFARLKKVIRFVDDMLKAVDPELTPLNIWDQIANPVTNCLNEINTYQQNKGIGHIQNANTHLDKIINILRPFLISEKNAAQAAGRAFGVYRQAIEAGIEDFKQNAGTVYNDMCVKLKELEKKKEGIDDYEKRLFEGDGEDSSLENKIDNLNTTATEYLKKIEDFHKKLVSGDEEKPSIILTIQEAQKNILNKQQIANEAYSAYNDNLNEIKNFHLAVYGEKNDAGEYSGGLKDEIDARKEDLENFKKEQRKQYQALNTEIESLLKGATSAGLASAFSDTKKTFDKPIKTYTKLFYISLTILFFVSLNFIIDEATLKPLRFSLVQNLKIQELLSSLILRLPIVLPVLWLTIFASKRRSENRRLQQEYAHKEAVAKSYFGFSKEIEKLNSQEKQLMEELISSAIGAIAFNPSSTLDGKHGDQMPLLELIEKLTETAPGRSILKTILEHGDIQK